MADPSSDFYRLKRGVSVLAACIVQSLQDSDPSLRRRFLQRLNTAEAELRDDWGGNVLEELELLQWTRELLSGYNPFTGEERPFLGRS